MFENVLGQSACDQLVLDIRAGSLAPAMLFSGPPSSGKGTAALELGRVISCEASSAAWDCACSACARHRFLISPDLLCLGNRPFCAEISASAGALLRDRSSASRILFIRSVRKLLTRFNPVLWEDEPKAGKIFPLVNSLEEDLDEVERSSIGQGSIGPNATEQSSAEKLIGGITKTAFKLESEGMSDTIHISQLRKAAWWSRLAPMGRGKLLIIENADRIQEEGRNSLLKLLEEPPPRVYLTLTTPRPGSLSATILSRLRVYRFGGRSAAVEEDVIRRVFRDTVKGIGIGTYLDSFLPVSADTLEAAAAFFAASAAYKAVLLSKKRSCPPPEEAVLLGKFCAPRAEAAGFGRPREDSLKVVELVLEKAEKFEIRSLFSRFIARLLEQVSTSLRQEHSPDNGVPGNDAPTLPSPAYYELWKQCSGKAETAVGVYNLRPAQALEKLFYDLAGGMAEL